MEEQEQPGKNNHDLKFQHKHLSCSIPFLYQAVINTYQYTWYHLVFFWVLHQLKEGANGWQELHLHLLFLHKCWYMLIDVMYPFVVWKLNLCVILGKFGRCMLGRLMFYATSRLFSLAIVSISASACTVDTPTMSIFHLSTMMAPSLARQKIMQYSYDLQPQPT